MLHYQNMAGLLYRIRPLYLLAAFLVGLVYVHFTVPPPTAVLKFPSPYNAGLVQYRDKGDACYMYRAEAVPCEKQSVAQPVIEDYKTKTRRCQEGS
jgi:hypothetical protein